MIITICRRFSIVMLTLVAIILSACEPLPPGSVNIQAIGPAKTNEAAWGPNATRAEITKHFSGNTLIGKRYGVWYFGNKGHLRVFDNREGRSFAVGKWRVDSSSDVDLLITELTLHHAIGGNHVVSKEEIISYRVYIKRDGDVALDIIADGILVDTARFYSPSQGFREAEFNVVRENVMAGISPQEEVYEPSAAQIAAGILFCVGTGFVLCL